MRCCEISLKEHQDKVTVKFCTISQCCSKICTHLYAIYSRMVVDYLWYKKIIQVINICWHKNSMQCFLCLCCQRFVILNGAAAWNLTCLPNIVWTGLSIPWIYIPCATFGMPCWIVNGGLDLKQLDCFLYLHIFVRVWSLLSFCEDMVNKLVENLNTNVDFFFFLTIVDCEIHYYRFESIIGFWSWDKIRASLSFSNMIFFEEKKWWCWNEFFQILNLPSRRL